MAKGLKPTGLPETSVIATPRRALDGTLRPHVLQAAGTPVTFTDYTLALRVDDMAAFATLEGLVGKTIYFVPSYHDPAVHTSYDVQVFFDRLGVPESPGPMVPYMIVGAHLMDAD